MVAVKKDAITGTLTPRHSSAGSMPSPGLPAAEGNLRPNEQHQPLPSQANRRDHRRRISLDDLFKQANRLSQLHKPHKANDAGWEAIEKVRARDGELGLNHFKLLKRLGCGDIGSVYLAELRDTKFRFAMKVMDLGSLASRRKQMRAETERDILSILDHPFLPTLYAHFETPQFLCLVMEFCSGGDLHTLRQKQAGRFFTDKSARFYAAEVLLALEYLHMMGVVYRDLKPENVLVRGDGHVMLSDFDLSLKCSVSPTLLTHNLTTAVANNKSPALFRDETDADNVGSCYHPISCLPMHRSSRRPVTKVNPSSTATAGKKSLENDSSNIKLAKHHSSRWKPRLSKSGSKSSSLDQAVTLPELVAEPTGVRSMSFVGTHEYLAPEIIAGDGHGSPVDWWTLGVFLFELLYGKTPFKGEENEITLVNVLAQPLEFPQKGDVYYREVDASAKELIKALLVKDPKKRLGFNRGATEVKQHPFFQGINWALIRCTLPPQIPRISNRQQQAKKRDDGLLPPSKLAILTPPQLQVQHKKMTESTVHFDYF